MKNLFQDCSLTHEDGRIRLFNRNGAELYTFPEALTDDEAQAFVALLATVYDLGFERGEEARARELRRIIGVPDK